jgi:hypothetical protein
MMMGAEGENVHKLIILLGGYDIPPFSESFNNCGII